MEGRNTAKSKLLDLIREETVPVRKPFGMYSQIGVSIEDITPEEIQIEINIGKPLNVKRDNELLDPYLLVQNVRGALVNQIGSRAPFTNYRVFYTNEDAGEYRKEFTGIFYDEEAKQSYSPSACIPVKGILEPHIEETHGEFMAAWNEFMKESSK